MASFTWHNAFEVHSSCMYQNLIPFYGQIMVHLRPCHIVFMHSSLDGHWSNWHFLAITDNAGINICSKLLLMERSGLSLVPHCIYLVVNPSLMFYMVKSCAVAFSLVLLCCMFEIWVLGSTGWSVHDNLVRCVSWLNLHRIFTEMLFSIGWLLGHRACHHGGRGATSSQPLVSV